jgi:hypothetical protein
MEWCRVGVMSELPRRQLRTLDVKNAMGQIGGERGREWEEKKGKAIQSVPPLW